jgi:parallel beta-helix repeat protein
MHRRLWAFLLLGFALGFLLGGCTVGIGLTLWPSTPTPVPTVRGAMITLVTLTPSVHPTPSVRPTGETPAGRMIELAPGIHPSMTITEPNVTVRGQPGAVIQATGWVGVMIQADGVTLENVTITGGNFGVFVTNASGVVVQGCDISGASWAGVMIASDDGPAHYNTVRDNEVHHNTHEGIYLKGQCNYSLIEGNDVHHNGDEGIQNTHDSAGHVPAHTIIRGNQVHENVGDWGGGMDLGGVEQGQRMVGVVVEANEVYSNTGRIGGIWYAEAQGGAIKNNVLRGNTGTFQRVGLVTNNVQGVVVEGNEVGR